MPQLEKKITRKLQRFGKGIAFLFFQTPWSGSSLLVLTRLKAVLRKLGLKDNLFIVDFEKEEDLATRYGVYKFPTILFLIDGTAMGKLENIVSEEDIVHFVDAFRKSKNNIITNF